MNHIFLTGDIQIGKTTVVNKTLALLDTNHGGFRTHFGPDRADADRMLYISDAAQPSSFTAENAVAVFKRGCRPAVNTDRFDRLGTDYIENARNNARLIVLDECGSFEQDALRFQSAILRAINGGIPVLGVVKQSSAGWTDTIRTHSAVTVMTVDLTNRDSLPAVLARLLRASFPLL